MIPSSDATGMSDPAPSLSLSIPLPLVARRDGAVPIHVVEADTIPAHAKAWAGAVGFTGRPGSHLLVPGADGGLGSVLFGAPAPDGTQPYPFAALSAALPPGCYELATPLDPDEANAATLAWVLGRYAFGRYKEADPAAAQRTPLLVPPDGADLDHVRRTAEAITFVRDLVNTPAQDMGPAELAAAALRLAAVHDARVGVIIGEDLLDAGYPLIHAVGRAAERAPRLIDLVWGEPDAPRLTLVGKGVCFDTGGLDLKPSAGMLLMKKDMGGAAQALGLAHMIMDAGLNLRLRVLIPAVENAVAGNAMRPGDVFPSRKGLTVEIGNTDAEGRLVLADALAEADEDAPDLLIDFATLTGAARVALGPDLPALFTTDDDLAAAITATGRRLRDPAWRLPLWPGYDGWLESKVADLNNVSDGGFAGAITAALFLQRFVTETAHWAHLDLFAWTAKAAPGRPVGGEAMTIRTLFEVIADRFDEAAL